MGKYAPPCIYKATSKTTGLSYIGQTTQGLHRRKLNHLKCINNNEGSSLFYTAMRCLGSNDFEWEILYEITDPYLTQEEIITILNSKEIEFIEKYDTLERGYNEREGGGNAVREDYSHLTQEEKEQIQKEKYSKKKRERHRIDLKRKQRIKEKHILNKEKINAAKRERHKNNEERLKRRRSYRNEYLRKYRAEHREELNKKQMIRKRERKILKEVMPDEVYDNRP